MKTDVTTQSVKEKLKLQIIPLVSIGVGLAILGVGAFALIKFVTDVPPPTGTANRFNVRDWGAVGDGISDDRAAIQQVIDAAGAAGGIVFFPPGTYKVDNSLLYIAKSNVTLLGSGYGFTTLRYNQNTRFIAVGAAATMQAPTLDNILIQDLRVTSTGTAEGGVAGRGAIQFDSGYGNALIRNSTIKNVMVDNVPTSGISIGGGTGIVVEGNIVRGTAEHGIYVSAAQSVADNVTIKNNTIYDIGLAEVDFLSPTLAIKVAHGATNTKVLNNNIYNFKGYGIILERGGSNLVQQNTVAVGYPNNYAIKILNSNDNQATNNFINMGAGYANAKAFFIEQGSSRNTISNNTIVGTPVAEVIDLRRGDGNRITGNTIANGPVDGWAILMYGEGGFSVNPPTHPYVAYNSVLYSGGFGIHLGYSNGAVVVDNDLSVIPESQRYETTNATDYYLQPLGSAAGGGEDGEGTPGEIIPLRR